MKIYGGVYYNEDGLSTAIRGMNTQTRLFGILNDNILGYNKTGYQAKEGVLSSFAEVIGANAISEVRDGQSGRITKTDKPLDLAIQGEGFFQYLGPQGIKATRDGRFKFDKDGYLLTLEDQKVLSNSGEPIKFKRIPDAAEDIRIASNGEISVLNHQTKELEHISTFGIVSDKGALLKNPDIKQGFQEASNVMLQTQFMNLIPVRRSFSANKQMFMIQNNILTQTIQQLGK